jgi:hypothetical protein
LGARPAAAPATGSGGGERGRRRAMARGDGLWLGRERGRRRAAAQGIGSTKRSNVRQEMLPAGPMRKPRDPLMLQLNTSLCIMFFFVLLFSAKLILSFAVALRARQ